MTSPTSHASESNGHAFSIDRIGVIIFVLATVTGLWLGIAGPDTSPVAPGSAPVPVLAFLFGAASAGVGP